MPPKNKNAAIEAALHQAEVDAKDAPKLAALITSVCTTCGTTMPSGETCVVDGTVAP